MKPLVIYHANCIDGSAAAACAYKYFQDAHGEAEFYPAIHGNDFDVNITRNRTVIFLDFSFKRDVILKIKKLCCDLVILDHHKTAEEELRGIKFEGEFDMESSGAMLAYKYFKPEDIKPDVIYRIQDRDLRTYKYEDTEEITSFFFSLPPFNTNKPDSVKEWLGYLNTRRTILQQLGAGCLKARKNTTELGVARAYKANMDGYEIWIANATDCFSEIAMELAKKGPFGATYHESVDGKYTYSLYSIGDFDVSEIAKQFNGGGHKNASGCRSFDKLHERIK